MGVVTTTRVQHASPAGAYAHTVNRNWYSDAEMSAQAKKEGCQDIATQMVYNMDIDVGHEGLRAGLERGSGPDTCHRPGKLRALGLDKVSVYGGGGGWDRPFPQTWWGR